MDIRDKNQELTGEGYMAPDSGMSPIQFDPGFALLTDNELATTLSENELNELPSWVYYFYSDLSKADMQSRQLPSFQYWLGTDELGRDLLARLMQGILISISVAVLVEIVDIVLGITVGVLAGFHGGGIDQVLARFTDIIFAFPGLLFIILVAGIFGEWADTNLSNMPIIGANGNARLLLVSLALAFVAWPLMARYVRGQTLQLKEQQFIEAARTAGTSNTR